MPAATTRRIGPLTLKDFLVMPNVRRMYAEMLVRLAAEARSAIESGILAVGKSSIVRARAARQIANQMALILGRVPSSIDTKAGEASSVGLLTGLSAGRNRCRRLSGHNQEHRHCQDHKPSTHNDVMTA
jgi:hypothetical protein